jgi:hypothetical protein
LLLCAASPEGAKTAKPATKPANRAHAQVRIVLFLAFFDEIKFSTHSEAVLHEMVALNR